MKRLLWYWMNGARMLCLEAMPCRRVGRRCTYSNKHSILLRPPVVVEPASQHAPLPILVNDYGGSAAPHPNSKIGIFSCFRATGICAFGWIPMSETLREIQNFFGKSAGKLAKWAARASMLHWRELQVLCCVVSERHRGLWENWLIAKTISPFQMPHVQSAHGGALSAHH